MKLQPFFSWQKYEGKPEDQKEQFQHQLQRQHELVANAINATINDASFYITERQTAFFWISNKYIWTKTITGIIVGAADTAYPHGITDIVTVVALEGRAQNATPLTTTAIPLPYVDPTTLANGVGIYADTTNIHVVTGNASRNGYPFSVTIYYTKS